MNKSAFISRRSKLSKFISCFHGRQLQIFLNVTTLLVMGCTVFVQVFNASIAEEPPSVNRSNIICDLTRDDSILHFNYDASDLYHDKAFAQAANAGRVYIPNLQVRLSETFQIRGELIVEGCGIESVIASTNGQSVLTAAANDSLTLKHLTITNHGKSSNPLINVANADAFTLFSGRVMNSAGGGIYHGSDGRQTLITIDASEISNNHGMGLRTGQNAVVTIHNSLIAQNSAHGAVLVNSVSGSAVDKVVVSDNGGHGLVLSRSSRNFRVTDSRFLNNARSGLVFGDIPTPAGKTHDFFTVENVVANSNKQIGIAIDPCDFNSKLADVNGSVIRNVQTHNNGIHGVSTNCTQHLLINSVKANGNRNNGVTTLDSADVIVSDTDTQNNGLRGHACFWSGKRPHARQTV